jgi:hypothetical protein
MNFTSCVSKIVFYQGDTKRIYSSAIFSLYDWKHC